MSDINDSPKSITRGQKIARSLIGILVAFLITFAMLEAMLYFIDPLGIVTYLHSFAMLWETSTPSETGYTFISGEHQMLDYTYTIEADESRHVPASVANDNCTIAAIGDSVTFGMGVDDEETWINLLAEQYHNVYFRNFGRPVFSAGNVLRSYQAYEADAYLWLIIDNDDFPDREYVPNNAEYTFATRIYWLYVFYPIFFGESPFSPLYEAGESAFDYSPSVRTAEAIADNSLILGFDELPASQVEQAIIIPKFTDINSPSDPHPSAIGHQQIADGILPYMDDFVVRHCG